MWFTTFSQGNQVHSLYMFLILILLHHQVIKMYNFSKFPKYI